MSIKLRSLFLLLVVSSSIASHRRVDQIPTEDGGDAGEERVPRGRVKRGIFWDFIQNVIITKNLVADQYIDTKNTFNTVYNLFNKDFSDPAPPKPTLLPTTTEKPRNIIGADSDNEIKSTTEKYSISRYEFGRILGRNFRGLKRLTDIEFQDALNQTKYNIQEYKTEARKQFSNSLSEDVRKKVKKG